MAYRHLSRMGAGVTLIALALAITPPAFSAPAAGPAQGTGGVEGVAPGSPAATIYGFNQLAGLPDTARLVYAYRLEGQVLEEPYEDEITVTFHRRPEEATGASGEGQAAPFDVEMTVFTRTRNQTVPAMAATRANPLLLFFFQHDGMRMSRNTGGSGNVFRNAMRRVMNTPAASEPTHMTLTYAGRPVAADAVQLRPYAAEASRYRMEAFANKVYRFTVSPDVPGGILELEAVVPGAEGMPPMLREVYRLKEDTP